MADISKITVPINGTNTTFNIKALKSLSVPIATVDSTSTSKAFTVQVPEFANETELRDGLFFFIYNNKVASASGWTLKVNNFDAKPVYNASAERTTTGFAKTRMFPIWFNSTLINGGCWVIGYLTDANTTYSGMSAAEITAGTSSTNRLISPAHLKTAIQTWAPTIFIDNTEPSSPSTGDVWFKIVS